MQHRFSALERVGAEAFRTIFVASWRKGPTASTGQIAELAMRNIDIITNLNNSSLVFWQRLSDFWDIQEKFLWCLPKMPTLPKEGIHK